MKSTTFDPTNAVCGALFVLAGLIFGYESFGMELGTGNRMGPGMFPLVLSCILVIFGIVILIQSMRIEGEPIGEIAWRGMIFILPAPIFFGLTVRGLGFVPAIFFTSLIACFASFKMKIIPAILLSAAITIFSVLVFSYGLSLPYQRFGPWLPF